MRRGQGIPILYYTGSANLRLKWTRASKYAKLELVPKFREKQPDLPLAKFHAEWKSGCKSVCVIISRNFRGYFDLVILRFCGGFRCRLAPPWSWGKVFRRYPFSTPIAGVIGSAGCFQEHSPRAFLEGLKEEDEIVQLSAGTFLFF